MSAPSSVRIDGSGRGAPADADLVGDIDGDAPIAVTVHFRRRTPAAPPGSADDLDRLMRRVTLAALIKQRARTHAPAAQRVAAFARRHGVTVRDIDLTGRRMVWEAPARILTGMFGASVQSYRAGSSTFRARTGELHVPREIAPWVRAVVGFDHRPLLRRALADADTGLWPAEIAAIYGIPLDRDVSSQCVGIIAMGGGYLASDLQAAMAGMGRAAPTVIEQSVGGVANQFGLSDRDDEELALDLQVVAGVLSRSRIVIYFTGNTAEALTQAIEQAARDDVNRPRVLSISWGSPEFYWTAPRREALCAALCDAARLGISVVTAAGDELATSGMTDGHAHVWFPASTPYVLACGGTSPTVTNGAITEEQVWKEGASGTGGGISDCYPVPAFQQGVALPPSVNDGHAGRGVPDVAAAAAKSPGYRIVVDGTEMAKDGTSAATPLWAALLAIVNAQRQAPLGLAAPHLYGVANLMREVTIGDNIRNAIGYRAGPGWNACTGLGVPRGADIITALAAVPVA